MKGLQSWIRANLRTMVKTSMWLLLVSTNGPAQRMMPVSVTSLDVLTQTEALQSPLASVEPDVEVVISPRPFGLDGLSTARLCAGLPWASSTLGIAARSSTSISDVGMMMRYRWNPMNGYVMGLSGDLRWLLIQGMDDVFTLDVDVAAGMQLQEWTLSVGLIDILTFASSQGPTLTAGLARTADSTRVMVDLRIPWNTSASIRCAAVVMMTETVRGRVAVASYPIALECALRCGISPSTDLVIDMEYANPLGMRTTLTLAMTIQ